jgi:hypothetical protein
VLPGEYETVFGAVPLNRSVYQRGGRGRVAVPLELRLGIVEGRYTPKMARVMTRAGAVTTEQEGAEFLAELGTARVSSSTLSRIPRAIAARYETRRDVIEVAVRERDAIPSEAVTVQVALDGAMVPQDGEHARPRGRKTDEPEPPRHERHYGAVGAEAPAANDGHQGRAWHEASVGTMAFFDADGRRLKTTYLGRMPEPHKATLVAQLGAELDAALAERPALNVVFASDGAPGHWQALDAMADRIRSVCQGQISKLVDAFHVAEYLAQAANAIEGEGTADAAILAAAWRETVKEKVDGAKTVLRSMRALSSKVRTAGRRKDLAAAVAYVANQHQLGRMRYAEAQARHYPIGTGITEAAAKTVIGTRMKRAGARFSQHGGQTILLFRTVPPCCPPASTHSIRNSPQRMPQRQNRRVTAPALDVHPAPDVATKPGRLEYARRVAEAYRSWYRTDPPDVGAATRAALDIASEDGGWQSWAGGDSAGNGSLMRATAPFTVRTRARARCGARGRTWGPRSRRARLASSRRPDERAGNEGRLEVLAEIQVVLRAERSEGPHRAAFVRPSVGMVPVLATCEARAGFFSRARLSRSPDG